MSDLPSKYEMLLLIKQYNNQQESGNEIPLVNITADEYAVIERLEEEEKEFKQRGDSYYIQRHAMVAKRYIDRIVRLPDPHVAGFEWSKPEEAFKKLYNSTMSWRKKMEEEQRKKKEAARLVELEKRRKIEDEKTKENLNEMRMKMKSENEMKKQFGREKYQEAQTKAAAEAERLRGRKNKKEAAERERRIRLDRAAEEKVRQQQQLPKSKCWWPWPTVQESAPNEIVQQGPLNSRVTIQQPATKENTQHEGEHSPDCQCHVKTRCPRSASPETVSQASPVKSIAPQSPGEGSSKQEAGLDNLRAREAMKENALKKPLKSALKVHKATGTDSGQEGMLKTWLPRSTTPEIETDENDADGKKAARLKQAHEEALVLHSEVRKF